MRWVPVWSVVWLGLAACSCRPIASHEYSERSRLFAPANGQQAVSIAAAGNEWVDFVVRVRASSKNDLRFRFVGLNQLGPDARVYSVDPTGRFLNPLRYDPGTATAFDLPNNGAIWIDFHVPIGTPAGDYAGACQFVQKSRVLGEIPLHLHVYGFAIPDRPTLSVAGEATAEGLRRLYHGHLPDSVNPLIALCRENRVELWFSDLQPTANFPARAHAWQCPANEMDDADRGGLAYRAYLNKSSSVICRAALTSQRNAASWFYAGDDAPCESVLIKRLRDAEENFEYIVLAEANAKRGLVHQLAGLLVRPINAEADSADRAMAGPMDHAAFARGKEFLAWLIEAKNVSPSQRERWNLQLVRWIAVQSMPLMLVRSTDWSWDRAQPGWINLGLRVDIYNPSDITAIGNTLAWSNLPAGWQTSAAAVDLPSLPAQHITPASIRGSFDATQLHITADANSRITFTSGYDAGQRDLILNLPVASCDRRAMSPIIDGSLSDWSADDTIFSGRLMGNSSVPPPSPSDSMILGSFSDSQLFLAFRTQETPDANCEMMIQPLFADNSLGKIFHVICKSNGASAADSPSKFAYAATVASGIWRGELAIPWAVLCPGNARPPSGLRFNFAEKTGASEIASWAGPVNREDPPDAITGFLVLRDSPGKLVQPSDSLGR